MFSIDTVFPRRVQDRALPWVVAAAALAAGLTVAQPYAVGVFHDDGAYAILAKSIAEGHGFRFLHLPGDPMAVHYPPGYPLLLAVLWWVFPEFPANVPVLLAANALFLGAIALGVQHFATRVLGWKPFAAAGAALVATLSLPLLLLSGIMVSEPLFAAVLFSVLAIAEGMVRRGRPRWHFLVFGLACGGLALIRTHGLALPAAAVVLLMWRRRWVEAAVCAGGVVIALAPWQVWQAMYATQLPEALEGSYGSYVGWFIEGLRHDGFLPRTLATNAREMSALVSGRFAFSDRGVAAALGSIMAVAVVAFGAWRAFARAPVTVTFAAIYLAIVMLWPYTPWRFVFGVWPLFVLFIGETLRFGLGGVRQRRPAAIMALAAGTIVAAGVVAREAGAMRAKAWAMPGRTATQQTVPSLVWIVRNTRPEDLVASEAAELVFLYTGRRSVPVMPFEAREYGVPRNADLDGAGLRKVVETLPVDYVATISRDLRVAAAGVAYGSGIRLSLVDTLSAAGVFRVTR
ncbi:MAG TPA: hypothetical protein VFO55_01345 [Gemmatimonadaceae bacterium]|nr:hypothetical protein [Gemmatimonadaceae bacterium]